MMAESKSDDSGSSSVPNSRFNEEYESLSDHEVASIINPFAASHNRSVADTTPITSRNLSASLSSGERSHRFSPIDSMIGTSSSALSPTITAHTINNNRPLNSLLDGPSTYTTTTTTTTISAPVGTTTTSTASTASVSQVQAQVRMAVNSGTSGMAGFLEMEEEPSRYPHHGEAVAERVLQEQDDLIDFEDEPISTTSGLLLTHRRSGAEKRASSKQRHAEAVGPFPASYRPSPNRFELESSDAWGTAGDLYGFGGLGGHGKAGGRGGAMLQARRLLSFAKLWVLFFCVVLLLGTGVIIHSLRRESQGSQHSKKNSNRNHNVMTTEDGGEERPQQILLLPLDNASELARQQREAEKALQDQQQQRHGGRRLLTNLSDLRVDFEEWIIKHEKVYPTLLEKERRFEIWVDNHHRTREKNKRHGDCPLMKKPVFGSNHLQDLTTEEFQSRFLTGYDGPNADGTSKTGRRRKLSTTHPTPVMHSGLNVKRHPGIHQRMLREWKIDGLNMSTSSCKWYDVSCWMRVIFQEYLYVGSGTMEPKYDADTYPKSFDWRDYGAVTDVRRQGDCGGCWGITAVETIESAYFIGTGTLLDLSETEVISCTDSCNMCFGGWPQDAYDYVMDHNGIMLADDWGYDGDTLLALSQEMEVDETELDEDLFGAYRSEYCPASQGSGDSGDNGGGEARYGNIAGYGFATERCVCYSDGSGCDCDNQNEGIAVRNLASYGPATVCLDAAVWQDYDGGIITSASGCSAEFLAMNHCVQVVGYAYNDGSGGDDYEEGDNQNSGSGSNSHDSGSGSGDESNRVGYWIVRNQWSQNWGMNGFAYVAMGDNTCGILNDMTQAYM